MKKERYVKPMFVNFQKIERSIVPGGPLPVGFLVGVATRTLLGDNVIGVRRANLEEKFSKEEK